MTQNELLRAWVAALESGKYPQAQKTLRTKDGFCCLGVACDVSGMGEWQPIADLERATRREPECSESTHTYTAKRVREEISLPTPVLEALGLTGEQARKLETMNDYNGATFAEIAQTLRGWFPDAFAAVAA